MNEEQLERLANLVDTAENYIALAKLPTSYKIGLEGLVHGMKQIRAEIKEIYLEAGGDDVWTLGDYDGD